MKKITIVTGLALALVLPAGAVAKPNPDQADRRAAKAECKTLRGGTEATREAFRTLHSSFVACVRKTAVDEAKEEQSAHTNAAKECKEEREANPELFRTTYGKNPNGRNAFGKCVSMKAKEKESEADAEDQQNATEWKNAAKECDNMRDTDAAGFAAAYGTRPNAFGKCVSTKAREQEGAAETA
jgi:hypothetical protein